MSKNRYFTMALAYVGVSGKNIVQNQAICVYIIFFFLIKLYLKNLFKKKLIALEFYLWQTVLKNVCKCWFLTKILGVLLELSGLNWVKCQKIIDEPLNQNQ